MLSQKILKMKVLKLAKIAFQQHFIAMWIILNSCLSCVLSVFINIFFTLKTNHIAYEHKLRSSSLYRKSPNEICLEQEAL